MTVKGRDSKTGMPREVSVTSTEVCGILQKAALRIADEILAVLEDTSPELVGDIADTGIVLTGGSSQLWGMDILLWGGFAVTFGLWEYCFSFLPKQNSTLFRFRLTSPTRLAKQFCPAA